MSLFTLVIVFGYLLLVSSFTFYCGMFYSEMKHDYCFTFYHILTLWPFACMIMTMIFNICILLCTFQHRNFHFSSSWATIHLWHRCIMHASSPSFTTVQQQPHWHGHLAQMKT
ncbi:hypothetical protein OG21DRAFT_90469 [Imleria badia]|nr:hypothetical protein OG21DRAFT_90469 [Imleria badia]